MTLKPIGDRVIYRSLLPVLVDQSCGVDFVKRVNSALKAATIISSAVLVGGCISSRPADPVSGDTSKPANTTIASEQAPERKQSRALMGGSKAIGNVVPYSAVDAAKPQTQPIMYGSKSMPNVIPPERLEGAIGP